MRPRHPPPSLRQRRCWLALIFAWWFAILGGAALADMLPSGLSVPSSVYGASYGDVAVPDAGGAVASAIVLTGAPMGAIVTSVQVAFDVVHEYPGDLAVWLVGNNSARQQRTKVLWSPGSRTATGLVATTVTTFNGAAANQSWQLVAQDTRTGDVGYLDQWSIRVSYLAPPSLRLPRTTAESGYLIGTLTPSLQWNTAYGATRYRVRAQASPYDALSTVYEGTINGTGGTAATLPPGRLLHGGAYRWLATSITSAGVESGFGVPLFFATPPAGTLVTPIQSGPGNSGDNNRAFLANVPPTFQWQSVVGATGYKVRVSEYPYDAGNEVMAQTVGLATSFTPAAGALIPGVRYRWTVTGLYSGGESTPWQGALYFEMSDPNAPQINSAVSASATRGSGFSYAITATNSPTSYGAVGLPEGLSVNAGTGAISGTPALTGAFNVLVKAFNAVGGANRLIIIDVRPPAPAITSTGSSSAVLGQQFSYQIVATENPTGYAAANLPAGLTFDALSGLITGAATAAGNFTINLSATNSGGTGTKNLTLGVSSGPPYDTKLAPRGVHENQPIGTVVGNFNTLDGDPGLSFSYALVAGAGADDNALFEIRAGEAALRTLAVFDYETRNTYSIRVRTTDNSGQFLDKQITVRVLNVIGEQQGGLHLSDATVLENQPAGTLVGFLSAVDPDPGETFAFAVVGGVDDLKFTVVGNQLRTTVPLDYEVRRFHDVRIRVTDSGGNALEESAVIEALDDISEDFDGDGLTQAQEAAIGTSDLIKDTDGDGSGDGPEVWAGTNPKDSSEFAPGTVVCWGRSSDGQINVPGTLTGVVAVAAGFDYSVALKGDGAVVAWGLNDYGQSNVPAGLTGVVAIAAGAFHSLALKLDGTMVAWGRNNVGERDVPAGLSGVLAVGAGLFHSLALKSDGTVVAWGDNSYGQTSVPAGLTEVVAIAAGEAHSLALKSDGTVVAWGASFIGQSNVPAGLIGVVAIAAGEDNSFALKSDGTVVAWGSSNFGQSGVPAGLTGAVTIGGGRYHSLAVRSMGVVPKLQGEPLLHASVGQPYAHQVVATGSGVVFSAMNLPPGLGINRAGIISGTPTQIGRYFVRLTAQNSAGRDVRTVRMTASTGNPPTAIGLTSNVVAEDVPVGTVVAHLLVQYAGGVAGSAKGSSVAPGASFTFVAGPGDANNAMLAIVGDALVTTAPLDYESAGALHVRVRATDAGANVIDQEITIQVLDVAEGETLTNWQLRNHIANLAQNTTGDGLTALHKYAFGLDPLKPTASPVRTQRMAMTDGQDYLTLTFPRAFGGTDNADGSYTYAGLNYRVEWSADLMQWSSAGITVIASGPAPGSPSGYRLVTARSPVPVPAQPRQFMRVVVLDVTEGETLANWKVRNNISNLGQITGGDGLTALHKYAFGLDPALPGTLPVQAQRMAMTDGQDYLTVTFPRAFGGTANGDGSYTYAGLTYRVEWSGDLVNWSSAGVAIVASGPAPGSPPGYRLVLARSPVGLPAQPRQFMRVVLTVP